MGEYVTITWGKKIFSSHGGCVICGRCHIKPFPKDYPDEWKFCCNCRAVAWLSVELPNKPENLIGIAKHVKTCSSCQKMVQKMKTGVYNKITLVGK